MSPKRLYTVVDAYTDDDYDVFTSPGGHEYEFRSPVECAHPDEWERFCVAKFGEVRPFFLPATGRIYKSRSAATRRADLINYWGGKAAVLECSPEWQTLADAKRGREQRRVHDRIQQLEDQLAVERAKFRELAS